MIVAILIILGIVFVAALCSGKSKAQISRETEKADELMAQRRAAKEFVGRF